MLTGSCGLKESCLFSCGCNCRAEDDSHSLYCVESRAQQETDMLPSDACLFVAALISCFPCGFQVLAL